VAVEAETCFQSGDSARAADLFHQAVRIDPQLAGAWLGLGRDAIQNSRHAEGHRYYLRAIAAADATLLTHPADYASLISLVTAYYSLALPSEAVASALRALAIEPDAELHRSMLGLMSYTPDSTPEAIYEQACRWEALHAAPLAASLPPPANSPVPGRRLRVGYVSPDLYSHAVAKFVQPVFEHHDRSQFEVFVYAVGSREDGCTAAARAAVERFVPFRGKGVELAARIRSDAIDILVDLAGHTMRWEFLQAFALRSAPVQATWVGMLATTGLSAIDYFIGDSNMPCPGTEHLFREAVYRLPGVTACYRPAADAALAPAPCLERGYITFGCYNQPAKINPSVVSLWAAILRAVPGSRLRLKYAGMESEIFQGRFQSWFAREGVPRERLEFAGASVAGEYMARYGDIDIALDPFPYTGGSTTLDAVSMGVPVVTLVGRTAVQCCSADILRAVGLPDTVAQSREHYIHSALFLAEIVGRIPQLRQNVREAFRRSPFRDEAGFVRHLEAAFREMWRRWCAGIDPRSLRRAG